MPANTCHPAPASRRAALSPIPLDAPVTSTVFMAARDTPARQGETARRLGRLRGCALVVDLMCPLRELLDDLGAERRQIVGIATGDQALIGDDLLVDHISARVSDVGADARV